MRQHAEFLDAIRVAVVEHGLPAREIAELAGLKERTIARHIAEAGLQAKQAMTPATARRRLARLAHDVLPKIEAAARDLADKKGEWSKARLDRVTQLSRLLDRFGELAVSEKEQQESAKDRDERTARALELIDRRIVELAEALARKMVADKAD
ncbi:MAG: hypothetical protein R3D45_05585 [Rhizobiaceae bacterium]